MAKFTIYCDNQLIDTDLISYALQAELNQCINIAVELTFVSKAEIKALNRKTRSIDKITDVLSYPMLNDIKGRVLRKKDFPLDYDEDLDALFLGSIAICLDKAIEQAEEYGHSEKRELSYLTVHAILHLFGYDHENDAGKNEMRETEERILTRMEVNR